MENGRVDGVLSDFFRGRAKCDQKILVTALGSTALKIAWGVKEQIDAITAPDKTQNVAYVCLDAAPQISTKFLEGEEFLHLEVEDTEGIMANINKHGVLRGQLPGLQHVRALSSIQNGVQGLPNYGAFALIHNIREVKRLITNRLAGLFREGQAMGNGLTVLYLLSPLGGVATGVLARSVYLTRNVCGGAIGVPTSHIGIVLLPVKNDLLKRSEREERIQTRNFYFALKQLETFTHPGAKFEAIYPSGEETHSMLPIFDKIILVGQCLARNTIAGKLAEVQAATAAYIGRYVTSNLEATLQARLADHDALINAEVEDKSRRAVVAGQITVEWPARDVFNVIVKRGASDFLRALSATPALGEGANPTVSTEISDRASSIVRDTGLETDQLVFEYAQQVTEVVEQKTKGPLAVGTDPKSRIVDTCADMAASVKAVMRRLEKQRVKLTVEKQKAAISAVNAANTKDRLPLLWSVEQLLRKEAQGALANKKAQEEKARSSRGRAEGKAEKAQRHKAGIWNILMSAGSAWEAAVAESISAGRAYAMAGLYSHAAHITNDIAAAIGQRRADFLKLTKAAARELRSQAHGDRAMNPAFDRTLQTLPLVKGKHLEYFYQRYASKDVWDVARKMEDSLGPLVEWGAKSVSGPGSFLGALYKVQGDIFESILDFSVADLLVGDAARDLGIDVKEVIYRAKKRLAPSALYTLAPIPNETRLPELDLVSFGKSKSGEVNDTLRRTLDACGFLENCVSDGGNPYAMTLMTLRVGLPLGALRSVKEWRNIYEATLEQEGPAELNIFSNYGSDELKDPELGSDDASKRAHPMSIHSKDQEKSERRDSKDFLTPFRKDADDSEEPAAFPEATMED